MTRNPEVAQAEAIAALAARLTAWGVSDPQDRAHEFVRDLIREGWRPRGPRCELTPEPVGRRTPAEAAPEDYRRAREALKGGVSDA